MKVYSTVILLFLFFNCHTQQVLHEKYLFETEDTFVVYEASDPSLDPGGSGLDQEWDFSAFTKANSTFKHSGSYQHIDQLSGIEGEIISHFEKKCNFKRNYFDENGALTRVDFFTIGDDVKDSGFYEVSLMSYTDVKSEVLSYTFPMDLYDMFTDTVELVDHLLVSDEWVKTFEHDPVVFTKEFDGIGMLHTAAGTFKNCLRFKLKTDSGFESYTWVHNKLSNRLAYVRIDQDRSIWWQENINSGGYSKVIEHDLGDAFLVNYIQNGLIEIKGFNGAYSYSLYDIKGQHIMSNQVIKGSEDLQFELVWPTSYSIGTYILLVVNKRTGEYRALKFSR